MGHEAPEMAEAEVVAVSAFEHVLLGVEAGDRQAVIARTCESNLLQTGEATLALVGMVQSRIDERGLQRGPTVIAAAPGGDDVFELVDVFLLLDVGPKGNEALEVHAVPVTSVLPDSMDYAEISFVQVSPGSLEVPERDREYGACYLIAGLSLAFRSQSLVERAADSRDLGRIPVVEALNDYDERSDLVGLEDP